jgi:hypothetical protein
MEEKQNSLGMHSMIWGAGTGVALIILSLILYVSNLYMNDVLRYVAYVILLAGMVISSLQYRKNQMKGFMTYGQAFSVSFLTGLFATIVSIIFFFFYMKYINTGLIDEIMAQVRTKMEAKSGSMSQEQMDQAMMWTERFMTPVWMIVWGFLGYTFWSAIFALVIGIFVRKKNPDAPTMI